MFSEEGKNSNFIVFHVTRQGLEPTLDRTRGEDAKHYTTDAVNHPQGYTAYLFISGLIYDKHTSHMNIHVTTLLS